MSDLIGGLVSNYLNRQNQERSYEQQRELQRDAQDFNRMMFDAANRYNSPMQQMARFQAAGLNPNLIYGQMANTASAPSMSSASAPGPAQTPAMSALETAQISLIDAQKENIQANTEKTLSDVDVNTSNINLNDSQMSLNRSMEALNEAEKKKVNAEIPLIGTQVKKTFQEYKNLKIEGSKLDAFYDAQINKLAADAKLSKAQATDIIRTLQHRINLLKAQANREGWDAQRLQKECSILSERYVQEQYATNIAQARESVEGTKGYQWTEHILGLVSGAVGSVAGVMLGAGALKGVNKIGKVKNTPTPDDYSDYSGMYGGYNTSY